MQCVGTYACTCTFTHMYAVCIHVHIHVPVHVQVISAFCSPIVYIHVHVYVDFYPVVHHSAEEAFNKCAVLNTCVHVHVHVYVYMYMHMYIHYYNTCMCCCSCVQICYITYMYMYLGSSCHQSSSGLQVLEGDELRKRLHNELVDLRGNIRVFCLMRSDIPEDREGTQADVVVLSDRDNDGIMKVLT